MNISFFLMTLILQFSLFFSNEAFGDNTIGTLGIHHQYSAPRALGMGDAFVAVASDYSAIYYNPAGLARREDGEINLSLDFGGTKSFVDFGTDLKSSNTAANATDSEKIAAMSSVLDKYYGKNFGARMGLLEGAWVRPGWGIGVIPMDLTIGLTVHKEVGPAVNVLLYGDTSFVYGYGTDVDWLNNGRLSMGFSAKLVNRLYTNLPVTLLELAFDNKLVKSSSLQEGYTIDGDLGFIYTPQIDSESWLYFMNDSKPSFAAVLRNVAESGFKNSFKLVNKTQTEAPEKLYRVLDIGTKFDLPQFWIFGGRFAMDVRDIMHPAFNQRKAFHAGLEFDWTVANWWKGQYRVGVNQGYYTLGLSALFAVFNLDLAYYGEDIGTYNNPLENRVLMVKTNINF